MHQSYSRTRSEVKTGADNQRLSENLDSTGYAPEMGDRLLKRHNARRRPRRNIHSSQK